MQSKRSFLKSVVAFVAACAMPAVAFAREYRGGWPWQPGAANPPTPYDPERRFLSDAERRFLKAAVDRLIPADDFPSASEAGTVDYIDGQLTGSFGRGDMYYLQGPFASGTDSQGYQGPAPAVLYRDAIVAIEKHLADTGRNDGFAALSDDEQDAVLTSLEDGSLALDGVSGAAFFTTLLQNTQEGYFGDPLYGGNRDMVGWKMLGFPGARYDYRPWVKRHNEKLDFQPVSLHGFSLPGGSGQQQEG